VDVFWTMSCMVIILRSLMRRASIYRAHSIRSPSAFHLHQYNLTISIRIPCKPHTRQQLVLFGGCHCVEKVDIGHFSSSNTCCTHTATHYRNCYPYPAHFTCNSSIPRFQVARIRLNHTHIIAVNPFLRMSLGGESIRPFIV